MAASKQQLPIGSDGVCMLCKSKPNEESTLMCTTCVTPWHVACLSVLPENMASAMAFGCPDCTGDGLNGYAVVNEEEAELFAKIKEIEKDETISENEKAIRRQRLMSGKETEAEKDDEEEMDLMEMLGGIFKCSYCLNLPERPVTTPCGHNFCLKCFEKWMKQGNLTCVKCRSKIPEEMAKQPRVNSTLVSAIRVAKVASLNSSTGSQNVCRFFHNQDRPDKAFVSEKAKKSGLANASCGKILVTLPSDHFGPIPAENDPVRNLGVMVGESWANRQEVRQWGIHYPTLAGISGQESYGAQSVVLSGGYEDDEDNGECFIYTGSGGSDLSGNKRTNKTQSFEQEFKYANQALRVSCDKGYPVRVVRSWKAKFSSYAPADKGFRYDGVYRIEKCWRKAGKQGFKMCRYLFVRCDNEPAPWASDEHGDRPRPLPNISEIEEATDVFERAESPSWDYDDEEGCWKWKKPPPRSKGEVVNLNPTELADVRKDIKKARTISAKENLLKGFSCLICKQVMNLPLTTPCGHNYCKSCLEQAFSGQTFVKERTRGGRNLRSRKNVMKCPSCPTDICDFLQNPQVNREVMDVIERLKRDLEKEKLNSKNNEDAEAEGNQESGLKRKCSSPEDEKEDAKKTKTDGGEVNDAEIKLPVETN